MPSTVIKSAGTCTATGLKKLYNDPAASSGTKFCFDAFDPISWPSQAAPASGSVLIDLMGLANATFGGGGAVGWANGFVFDSSDADQLMLPTSSKIAPDATAAGITLWLEFKSTSAGNYGLFDLSDDTALSTQYGAYRDGNKLVVRIAGTAFVEVTIATAILYQIGITSILGGGTWTHTLWINGVPTRTLTTASMPQPAAGACSIGTLPSVSTNGDGFIFYRAHRDDLSSRTAQDFIEQDFSSGLSSLG